MAWNQLYRRILAKILMRANEATIDVQEDALSLPIKYAVESLCNYERNLVYAHKQQSNRVNCHPA